MSPRARVRVAYILIPLAVAIAIFSAVVGNWITPIAMVFLIASQVMNVRSVRRQSRD